MALADSGYPLLNVIWSICVLFAWILFFWLLITVWVDVFRRDDIGGWAKAGWLVFTIVLPFIGVFTYLIVEGRAMESRRTLRMPRGGQRDADELERAKQMLDSGANTQDQYLNLKQRTFTT